MGNDYTNNAALYLIDVVFGIYMMLVLLRLLLQMVRADFHNPLSQFIVTVTNPPLLLLRRVIPSFSGLDLAAIALLLGLQAIELSLILIINGVAPDPTAIFVISIAELLELVLNLFLITIIIQIIMSWFGSGYHPVAALLHSLNAPILRPAQRFIPPMSGIDFSPMATIVMLQILKLLLVAPIADLGRSLISLH